MRSRLLLLLAPLLLALLADQALLYTALSDGEFLGRRLAPFDPPLFNAAQRESLERVRARLAGELLETPGKMRFDALLGWSPVPGDDGGDFRYDEFGTRVGVAPIAALPQASVRRLVVTGESFTHGDEVGSLESWPAQLDLALPGWEVANLGVGAYGMDQALLRFRRDGKGLAPRAVWLGFMISAAPRLSSVYRPALRHHELSISFKPRFELAADESLTFVPNPAGSEEEMVRLLEDQRLFLARVAGHDFWVDHWPAAYGPAGSHWSHHLAAARLALTRLEGRREHPAECLADPGCELFRLASAIAVEFSRECRASGAEFRVVLLPDRKSLDLWEERGARPWRPFVDELLRRGVPVTDLSEALAAAGARTDPGFWRPGGHYSPRANAAVARELRGLLD
ncbi:MAG: hypothetical protein HY812_20480 [Planctomycetes bacterium]|nr:hypothetical protein [Planctomycetota bacterium]